MALAFLHPLVDRMKLVFHVFTCNDEAFGRLTLALKPVDPIAAANVDESQFVSKNACHCDEKQSEGHPCEDCGFQPNTVSASSDILDASTPENDLVSELGREIAERIGRNLQEARSKTEDAVISVCDQVARLVDIARQGNAEAQGTLQAIVGGPNSTAGGSQEASVSEVIQMQTESVNAFVEETRRYFHQQMEAANTATATCREMQTCVAQVVKLVFSSEILAYNIQIESARLGDQGRAFSVLGDEMVRFSSKVRDANIAIQKSLNQVNESMMHFHAESKCMDQRLGEFTDQLQNRIAVVEQRTLSLTDSLHMTLDRITTRNREVIECSQTALSELQFQDPLAQSLLRTEHEVNKLQSLLETGSCELASIPEPGLAIGLGESHDREPGIVDFF